MRLRNIHVMKLLFCRNIKRKTEKEESCYRYVQCLLDLASRWLKLSIRTLQIGYVDDAIVYSLLHLDTDRKE